MKYYQENNKKIKVLFNIILFYPLIDLIFNFYNNTKVGILYNSTFIIILFIYELMLLEKKEIIKFMIYNMFIIIFFVLIYKNEGKITFESISFINFINICNIFNDRKIINNFKLFIISKEKIFLNICIIYIFMIFFSCIFKIGYENSWGTITLKGPYLYNHILAYISNIIYIVSNFYYNLQKNKKKWFIIMVISFIFIILSAVRSAVLFFVILIFNNFVKLKLHKKFKVIIVILLSAFIFFNFTNILNNNPLIQKNKNTFDGGSLSNGRDIFWKEDIRFFTYGMSFKEKIVGVGVKKLKEVNYSKVGLFIHAHNDFITTIIAFGIIGLLIFVVSLLEFCKFKGGIFLFLGLFTLAFTNGLFMYVSFVICIPFLVVGFSDKYVRILEGDVDWKI